MCAARGRTLPQQLALQPAFLAGLAQRRLLRIFIQLDVPAQRQPLVQRAMMDEQHPAVVHDKDRDREVNFLVDMCHSGTALLLDWLAETGA